MSNSASNILIASDDVSDANLVKEMLAVEFSNVFTSTTPDRAVEDFERHAPSVLVLGFKALEKAERYYLGLYRQSRTVQTRPHRTVILCHKDDVKRVSELCLKQHFDDYILFWPMNHDAPRLVMSVHLAIRNLAGEKNTGPSVAEFAAQARQVAELESLLEQQVSLGGQHIEAANLAMDQAKQNVGAALDGFAGRLARAELKDVVEIKNVEGMQREISRLNRDEIQHHLSAASAAVQPLKQWNNGLRQECTPHLESIRALSAMAERVKPVILVVDDDDFQLKLIAKILGAENYQLIFANSGTEALSILRNTRPDLILMDVVMPDIDGLEMTRRLKATPHLSSVPVMMISGKSEGNVVLSCLKAGAVDFAVKPFDLDSVKVKVARWARPKSPTKSTTLHPGSSP